MSGWDNIWTAVRVENRMREAAWVLRRMCHTGIVLPSSKTGYWPEVVRTAYDYPANLALRPAIPSPQEIDRMDEAIPWLFKIDHKRDRAVVWARAMGYPWRKISRLDGRSARTLRRKYSDLLEHIANQLSAGPHSVKSRG